MKCLRSRTLCSHQSKTNIGLTRYLILHCDKERWKQSRSLRGRNWTGLRGGCRRDYSTSISSHCLNPGNGVNRKTVALFVAHLSHWKDRMESTTVFSKSASRIFYVHHSDMMDTARPQPGIAILFLFCCFVLLSTRSNSISSLWSTVKKTGYCYLVDIVVPLVFDRIVTWKWILENYLKFYFR